MREGDKGERRGERGGGSHSSRVQTRQTFHCRRLNRKSAAIHSLAPRPPSGEGHTYIHKYIFICELGTDKDTLLNYF